MLKLIAIEAVVRIRIEEHANQSERPLPIMSSSFRCLLICSRSDFILRDFFVIIE